MNSKPPMPMPHARAKATHGAASLAVKSRRSRNFAPPSVGQNASSIAQTSAGHSSKPPVVSAVRA
jgi:hypothetical protein